MFIDKTKIYIKAGDGGDGAVSFRKEKYVPNGGPDGGNGGNGGDIIFKASPHMNNLVEYHYTKHFRAENGVSGGKNNKFGKNGKDIIIPVPRGTVIKDAQSGKVIADMFFESEQKIILKGGRGGRGNAKFASSTRQAPGFSETGEKTLEKEVFLELKTIADVGLVGFPNVGKSTLLSVLTAAKPKIGNYHFTTLSPNLGVASYKDKNFIIADIPGLIEGASEGIGLGHDFLRHIERTKMLVHVVDISGIENRKPLEDFDIINKELESYSKKIMQAPQIIYLNKTDLLFEDFSTLEEFVKKHSKQYKIIKGSAATRQGIEELLKEIASTLATLPEILPEEIEIFDFDKVDRTTIEIIKTPEGAFEVKGGLIEELIRGVVLSDPESFAYFQKRLKRDGIIEKLKEHGMKEGDSVKISHAEFEYHE